MSDISVGTVVTQFQQALDLMDQAAVSAKQAQEQAQQAKTVYAEASRGTANRAMREAVTNSGTAADKAGKTARLLSEAAEHLTNYINIIAPGSVAARASSSGGMPDGARMVDEAMARRRRASSFLDRAARRADDVQDAASEATKVVGEGTKAALKAIKGDHGPGSSGSTSTTTSSIKPASTQPVTAHDTVSALTVSLLAAALVGRSAIDYIKRRHDRRNTDGNK